LPSVRRRRLSSCQTVYSFSFDNLAISATHCAVPQLGSYNSRVHGARSLASVTARGISDPVTFASPWQ
ncbi:hypothetical protein GQ607_005908, partial [Colletotrichum asianum]